MTSNFVGRTDFYPRPLRGGRPEGCHVSSRPWVFLSTPSARRATEVHEAMDKYIDEFLSTPSARRATRSGSLYLTASRDFYPRPLRGGRRGVLSFDGTKSEFLSTPSARRATPVRRGAWSRRGYFYPRPLRGGRPRYLVPPRASFSNFYPRPLRGGRLGVHAVSMFSPIFLSTPSARRATKETRKQINHTQFLSTPSARRATLTENLC